MQNGEEESKKLLRDVEKQQIELTAKYEEEQAEIKAKLAEISQTIDRQKLRESCIRSFIKSANRYVDMPKLTPELLRTFIKRIEIHEKEQRFSRTAGNRIDIYFTFSPESGMIADGEESGEETQLLAAC